MRFPIIIMTFVLAGCGADMQYSGGVRGDESNAAPEGQHAIYVDPPNFPYRDDPFLKQPQPAGAELPGDSGR